MGWFESQCIASRSGPSTRRKQHIDGQTTTHQPTYLQFNTRTGWATPASVNDRPLIALPGIAGYVCWYLTYLRQPTTPAVLLPPFMLSVAAFAFHLIEEYGGGYPLAISRMFHFAWTDFAFFATVCALMGALLLVCIGLYYQKPIAGFLAILFLMTRLSELAMFVFPYVRPALQPDNPNPVSDVINGTLLSGMPSYYYPATHHYCFPGMYTFVRASPAARRPHALPNLGR